MPFVAAWYSKQTDRLLYAVQIDVVEETTKGSFAEFKRDSQKDEVETVILKGHIAEAKGYEELIDRNGTIVVRTDKYEMNFEPLLVYNGSGGVVGVYNTNRKVADSISESDSARIGNYKVPVKRSGVLFRHPLLTKRGQWFKVNITNENDYPVLVSGTANGMTVRGEGASGNSFRTVVPPNGSKSLDAMAQGVAGEFLWSSQPIYGTDRKVDEPMVSKDGKITGVRSDKHGNLVPYGIAGITALIGAAFISRDGDVVPVGSTRENISDTVAVVSTRYGSTESSDAYGISTSDGPPIAFFTPQDTPQGMPQDKPQDKTRKRNGDNPPTAHGGGKPKETTCNWKIYFVGYHPIDLTESDTKWEMEIWELRSGSKKVIYCSCN